MENGHGSGGPVGGPPRTRYNRMQSDPGWNRYNGNGYGNGNGYPNGNGFSNGNGYSNGNGNGYSSGNGYNNGNGYSSGNGVYPSQGYQQSRDTVDTNGSNGSHSEPYASDPSSDNSSVERATPVKPPQPDLGEQYGFQGFGNNPVLEEYASGPARQGYFVPQPTPHGVQGPPPVPAKTGPPPPGRKPVATGTPAQANGGARPAVMQRQNTDKRKSWFKRRFSKD